MDKIRIGVLPASNNPQSFELIQLVSLGLFHLIYCNGFSQPLLQKMTFQWFKILSRGYSNLNKEIQLNIDIYKKIYSCYPVSTVPESYWNEVQIRMVVKFSQTNWM